MASAPASSAAARAEWNGRVLDLKPLGQHETESPDEPEPPGPHARRRSAAPLILGPPPHHERLARHSIDPGHRPGRCRSQQDVGQTSGSIVERITEAKRDQKVGLGHVDVERGGTSEQVEGRHPTRAG